MILLNCEQPHRQVIAPVELSSPSLLVVDDDEHFRTLARHLLSPRFNVQEASNTADCIRFMRLQAFDAIIVDMVMPDSDGIEAICDIKRLKPDTKIVAVSGAGESSLYLQLAERLGVHATLSKASVETLRSLLEVVLQW
ncbi:MAG TPA: response regulator [Bryobacteraceae bacterium]|nr:response regulator [Bryobacteraceae bacterium]